MSNTGCTGNIAEDINVMLKYDALPAALRECVANAAFKWHMDDVTELYRQVGTAKAIEIIRHNDELMKGR